MAHHHPRSALATSRRRDVAPESVDLLRRAQRGDREAFGRLYAEHLSVITRYVAVRLRDRDRHAIPDVVHDAFTDALAELAGAHDDVRGWLLQLAARACTRHGWTSRRYLRAAHEIHDHQRTAAPSMPPPASPATVARWAWVLGLARLTDNQRHAIQLRYLDGLPRVQAARLMDRSTEAVRDLERRGLRRLHTSLAAPQMMPAARTGVTR